MKKKDIEKFVRKYADLVYRVAYTILKNKDNTDDIFQEVFMKLCTENVKFLNENHEKAWIIKVTKNKCLDFFKKAENKRNTELDENLIEDESFQDNNFVLNEVMKLPDKYRIIIYLFYFEGYKISEISKITDTNESTVKSQLTKARDLLKISLKEEF